MTTKILFKKWTAAAAAAAILAGGVLPTGAASLSSQSAFAAEADSFAYLQSEVRVQLTELILSNEQAENALQLPYGADEHFNLYKISREAAIQVFDPSVSDTKLRETYRKFVKEYDSYLAFRFSEGAAGQVRQVYRSIESIHRSQSEPFSPETQAYLDFLDRALEVFKNPQSGTPLIVDTFKTYMSYGVEQDRAKPQDAALQQESLRVIANREISLNQTMAASSAKPEDYAAQLQRHREITARVQAIIGDPSTTYNVRSAAYLSYFPSFNTMEMSLLLAEDLVAARTLMESPAGIRSGQYPASAFGDLRVAINKATYALQNEQLEIPIKRANYDLNGAIRTFRGRLVP